MGDRLKTLLSEYGRLAIGTYLTIFVVTLVGFATAIEMGIEVEGVAGTTSLWGAAWLGTKLTQPLRILATLGLTPLVAIILRRKPTAQAEAQVTPQPEPKSE